jgi:hypothetical protein
MNPYGRYSTPPNAHGITLDRWSMALLVIAMMRRGATITSAVLGHADARWTTAVDDVADVLAWERLGVYAGL